MQYAPLLDQVYALQHALSAYTEHTPDLQNDHDLLAEARVLLQEAAHILQQYVEQVDTDLEHLQKIERRLATIYDTARKHHIDAWQLYSHWQDLQQQIADHSELDNTIHAAEQLDQQANSAFFHIAHQLSTQRTKAANPLANKVTDSLQTLGMHGGKFTVQLSAFPPEEASENGLEQVEFQVSTNPGQPLNNMSTVVSGGELSRLSLAIQVLTAAYQATPTLLT